MTDKPKPQEHPANTISIKEGQIKDKPSIDVTSVAQPSSTKPKN